MKTIMKFIKTLYDKLMSTITLLSPELTSKIIYMRAMRKPLNLSTPRTFSEKLMYLKLRNYNQNETVWMCADKLGVRKYLNEKGVGEENLPKLLKVYRSPKDIDFNSLPDKFALKCTHGAGFNIICTDKGELNKEAAILNLEHWMKKEFGLASAELHYGKYPRSIICEEFIEPSSDTLPIDYKIYCFDGNPKYILACTERVGDLPAKLTMFSLDWKDTNFIKNRYYPESPAGKPKSLEQMLKLSKKISSGFPFVRIDFYEHNFVPIVGEMTFTPHACLNYNMTDKGQAQLGDDIRITTI